MTVNWALEKETEYLYSLYRQDNEWMTTNTLTGLLEYLSIHGLYAHLPKLPKRNQPVSVTVTATGAAREVTWPAQALSAALETTE